MEVESKVFKSKLGNVKSQELDKLIVCNASCSGGIVGVVSTDQEVRVSAVFFGGGGGGGQRSRRDFRAPGWWPQWWSTLLRHISS